MADEYQNWIGDISTRTENFIHSVNSKYVAKQHDILWWIGSMEEKRDDERMKLMFDCFIVVGTVGTMIVSWSVLYKIWDDCV